MKKCIGSSAVLIASLVGCASNQATHSVSSERLFDEARGREIPLFFTYPRPSSCVNSCNVAFISPGYNVSSKNYQFIADELSNQGFFVVGIDNQLPSDPPLPTSGNLIELRAPFWDTGADNIIHASTVLSRRFPEYDWPKLLLVGHSQGGDISAWLASRHPSMVSTVVSLDHRRVPLPDREGIRVLNIRASQYEPDPGAVAQSFSSNYCVVVLEDTMHNDLDDGGPQKVKDQIVNDLRSFIGHHKCPDGT